MISHFASTNVKKCSHSTFKHSSAFTCRLLQWATNNKFHLTPEKTLIRWRIALCERGENKEINVKKRLLCNYLEHVCSIYIFVLSDLRYLWRSFTKIPNKLTIWINTLRLWAVVNNPCPHILFFHYGAHAIVRCVHVLFLKKSLLYAYYFLWTSPISYSLSMRFIKRPKKTKHTAPETSFSQHTSSHIIWRWSSQERPIKEEYERKL